MSEKSDYDLMLEYLALFPKKERDTCRLYKRGDCSGLQGCANCDDYVATVPPSDEEKSLWPKPSTSWWK